ncbi:MAG: cytochrome c, partial [Alphaproteobacteria bacterium]|nr:cytochrome c [Alphaproteobacteria bacterium]
MRKSFAILASASVLALMATAAAAQNPPPTAGQQEVSVGARVYAKCCASCHGAILVGQPNLRQRNEN